MIDRLAHARRHLKRTPRPSPLQISYWRQRDRDMRRELRVTFIYFAARKIMSAANVARYWR